MPRDVEIGRALAESLHAEFSGVIANIRFDYDTWIDLSDLPNEPFALVSLDNQFPTREGRSGSYQLRWEASLMLTLISSIGPKDDPYFVDATLDSFDLILENALTKPVNGKRPMNVEVDERMEPEKWQTHNRVVMQARLNYLNL